MAKRRVDVDDAALASLIALLDPASFPPDSYVDALLRADGDVSRAAEILLLGEGTSGTSGAAAPVVVSGSSTRPQKRPRNGGLTSWLNGPKAGRASERDGRVKREDNRKQSLDSQAPAVEPEANDTSQPAASRSPTRERSSTPAFLTAEDRAASAASWSALLKPDAAKLSDRERDKEARKRMPTMHLTSVEAIAGAELPLALLQSPLSPPLAAALYHELMAESPSWPKRKFFLAGREVQSNHQSTAYCRPGGGYGAQVGVPYYYSGTEYEVKPFTPLLSQAAQMVEDAVNAHLDTLPRYPLEFRGKWRANMCAANRYDGAVSTVGWHADQLTYLGPYPTIASLSLGTPRAFRLRPTEAVDEAFASSRPTRTYEVTLGHNSLCLMVPGCQERYKHTVPPQRALDLFRPAWDAEQNPIPPADQKPFTSRINITFRFYRDDFHPGATPRCKCGIPSLLRADQKAKARSFAGVRPGRSGEWTNADDVRVKDDDMAFFWQCQTPGASGDLKGCGFFKILDMKGEGRGPCVGDARGEAVDGEADRGEHPRKPKEDETSVVDAGSGSGEPKMETERV